MGLQEEVKRSVSILGIVGREISRRIMCYRCGSPVCYRIGNPGLVKPVTGPYIQLSPLFKHKLHHGSKGSPRVGLSYKYLKCTGVVFNLVRVAVAYLCA